MDRQLCITEAMQNGLNEHVEVGPIIRPEEFPGIEEPSSMRIILRTLTLLSKFG